MANPDINNLLSIIKNCADALNVAFDAEGDTFGIHHNDATDALIDAEAILKLNGIEVD